MDQLGRMSVSAFKESPKKPIMVILDNIRSMHNVGSVFRTADAFLLSGICLCGYTPQPPHRDINKTALGATESVDWIYFEETQTAVMELKNKGFQIFAVEQVSDSISLANFEMPNSPVAFIFGNEVEGVSASLLPLCHGCIEIPQWGMKHSLNISVATGIVLWEAVRQIGLHQIQESK